MSDYRVMAIQNGYVVLPMRSEGSATISDGVYAADLEGIPAAIASIMAVAELQRESSAWGLGSAAARTNAQQAYTAQTARAMALSVDRSMATKLGAI